MRNYLQNGIYSCTAPVRFQSLREDGGLLSVRQILDSYQTGLHERKAGAAYVAGHCKLHGSLTG